MKTVKTLPMIILLLVIPTLAMAVDMDLRLKLGSASGADEMNVDNIVQATGDGDGGTNGQIEFLIAPLTRRTISPVFGIGLFSRKHSGSVSDAFAGLWPTKVDYRVSGVSLTGGIRVRPSANLHFEGRLELGLGEGKPTLETPGSVWHEVKSDAYASLAVIAGAYYTFPRPRLQVGLELGAQSFSGDFKIWNSSGFWSDGTVNGGGGTANLVVGYRF